jgi:hypothetical protein
MNVLRRLSVTVASLLGFLVVMGALLGVLVVPVLDSPPTRPPTAGPSEPDSAGDGDESVAEAPAPTPDGPATNVFFVDIGAALDRHRATLVTTDARP